MQFTFDKGLERIISLEAILPPLPPPLRDASQQAPRGYINKMNIKFVLTGNKGDTAPTEPSHQSGALNESSFSSQPATRKCERSPPDISAMPRELQQCIFDLLDLASLAASARVSRAWLRAVRENSLLAALCR